MESRSSRGLFRRSELPRFLILTALMIGGWGLVWWFARTAPQPVEAPLRVAGHPEPVVPDPSPVFETVTDRTVMGFRDNAAYAYLLEKSGRQSPRELATQSRRDILLTHLWERPENYRGVPVHVLGTVRRVLRFESKLSKTGWLYEAWIVTPDASRYPYTCVFEEAPNGFPLGADVSERVVFNGYFLKIMKYQAGDLPRGAPVLIGKIGWDPATSTAIASGEASTRGSPLSWMLPVLGLLFLLSLARLISQLYRHVAAPREHQAVKSYAEELPDGRLDQWAASMTSGEVDNAKAELPEEPQN